MTHSSRKRGWCVNPECRHHNDSHEVETCRARRCTIQWKRCNVAPDCAGVQLRICKTCPNHPGAGPSHWENGSNIRSADNNT
ncbi:uncharacterized protein N7506_003455 [Penicillium brevicompactum]|uniref:uncharacterized protein n=1 Tax=Penicillium brevicompactum TaxID=5074 RepID=UPI002540F7D6|nr:uncharacterized protein N7506_003455 [Penicillium brevicompactum]KAJ5343631.1 hypothetical protein N7506_003455 [Penicillium brevicompactum]